MKLQKIILLLLAMSLFNSALAGGPDAFLVLKHQSLSDWKPDAPALLFIPKPSLLIQMTGDGGSKIIPLSAHDNGHYSMIGGDVTFTLTGKGGEYQLRASDLGRETLHSAFPLSLSSQKSLEDKAYSMGWEYHLDRGSFDTTDEKYNLAIQNHRTCTSSVIRKEGQLYDVWSSYAVDSGSYQSGESLILEKPPFSIFSAYDSEAYLRLDYEIDSLPGLFIGIGSSIPDEYERDDVSGKLVKVPVDRLMSMSSERLWEKLLSKEELLNADVTMLCSRRADGSYQIQNPEIRRWAEKKLLSAKRAAKLE